MECFKGCGARIDNKNAVRALYAALHHPQYQIDRVRGCNYSPASYISLEREGVLKTKDRVFSSATSSSSLFFHHYSSSSRRAILFGVKVAFSHHVAPASSSSRIAAPDKSKCVCLAVMALSKTEMYQVHFSSGNGFFENNKASCAPSSSHSCISWEESGTAYRIVGIGSCIFGYWALPNSTNWQTVSHDERSNPFALLSVLDSRGRIQSASSDDAWSCRPVLLKKGFFSAWDALGPIVSKNYRDWKHRYTKLHEWIDHTSRQKQPSDIRLVINPCTPFSLFAPWVRRAKMSGLFRSDMTLHICIFLSPFGVGGKTYHWYNDNRVRLRCITPVVANTTTRGGENDTVQSYVRIQSDDRVSLGDIIKQIKGKHAENDNDTPHVHILGLGTHMFRCGGDGRVCDFQVRQLGENNTQKNVIQIRFLHCPVVYAGLRVCAMQSRSIVHELQQILNMMPFEKLYAISQSISPSWFSFYTMNRRFTAKSPERQRLSILPSLPPPQPPLRSQPQQTSLMKKKNLRQTKKRKRGKISASPIPVEKPVRRRSSRRAPRLS